MSLIKGITGIAKYICKNLNFPKAWHSMIYEWTIKPLLKLWKLVIVFNTRILNVLFVNKNTSRSIRSRLGFKNSMIVCRCLTYMRLTGFSNIVTSSLIIMINHAHWLDAYPKLSMYTDTTQCYSYCRVNIVIGDGLVLRQGIGDHPEKRRRVSGFQELGNVP